MTDKIIDPETQDNVDMLCLYLQAMKEHYELVSLEVIPVRKEVTEIVEDGLMLRSLFPISETIIIKYKIK
jgi:hypothetical protein